MQFNIPPHLCNPRQLHFARTNLNPDELFEQKAVNTILPCPYHPSLDSVESKHAIRCLVVAVHCTLRQKLFMKFLESQGNVADMFKVERKMFFTSIMGRTYDGGKNLTKAEKKEKEMKELRMKKLKLKDQTPKVEKQKEEKQKEEK